MTENCSIDGPLGTPADAGGATPGDLLTCGLCGQEFPLPNLAAFIGHKSLGTCRPREGDEEAGQRLVASPSVTASDQVERVESSGGDVGEEEVEGRSMEEQADAATNTGVTAGINYTNS